MFERTGARCSLLFSSLAYALSVGITGVVFRNRRHYPELARCWIMYMFVAKSAFVQLLFSQHWTFLTSLLSSTQNNTISGAARWSPVIAGLASVAATVSSGMISPLLDYLKRQQYNYSSWSSGAFDDDDDDDGAMNGLTDLLTVSMAILLLTSLCADTAYRIAEENNIAPKKETCHERDCPQSDDGKSFINKAKNLFHKTPVLGGLFLEVLVYQSIVSFLSHLYIASTKQAMPMDDDRAKYTGKVFAWINGGSGILQFVILPLLLGNMRQKQIQYLWVISPCFTLLSAFWMLWKINYEGQTDIAFVAVTTMSFSVVKILDYSLRGVLMELVGDYVNGY